MGSKSCWDMHLMTHCKDLIIANSSFSWWGAFLNNFGGRVIAPKRWVNRDAEFDIYDESWIRIRMTLKDFWLVNKGFEDGKEKNSSTAND